MESFSASNVGSIGTRCLNLNLYPSMASFTLRYGGDKKMLLSPIGVSERNRREARSPSSTAFMTVRGMGGGAKFRGTQMREKKLAEMIENKVMEAKEVCEGDGRSSDECKVAWGEVEEVSQAKADLRRKLESEDPLESFCQGNPETDECRVDDD